MTINKFFRFIGEGSDEKYGEVPRDLPSGKWFGSEVTVLAGDPYTGLTVTSERSKVKEVCHKPDHIHSSSFELPRLTLGCPRSFVQSQTLLSSFALG